MNAELWKEVWALFDAALQRDAGERDAFLDERCGGNPALRHAVETLLEAHYKASTFLELTEPVERELPPELAEEIDPRRIGPYKILGVLGEGGMGIVYLAEQEQPLRRRVALKLIKLGMDTKRVIARFEAERQALALMDHPGIARVLDAGTSAGGRPYFVMELVSGVPITEHCDRHRLGIEQRLDLFRQTCEAVQHAHQKGVIHRDIKPSNILVVFEGGRATPKIIDFGVAKALSQPLTERTLFTRSGQLIGTPAYMSPEQARMTGQDVDTRTDVYSLGVLLYELLTGVLPFDPTELRAAGFDEMRRIIVEVDPHKPSDKLSTLSHSKPGDTDAAYKRHVGNLRTLERKVRNDLDWITMKCLDKDRTRRYATAQSLGEDIERFLRSQPVMARAPSALYRARKFVRRNRQAVAAGCVIGLVLVAGVVGVTLSTLREAHERGLRLAAERDLARREAADVLDEARGLIYEFPRQARARAESALAMDPELLEAKIFLAYQEMLQGDQGRAVARTRRLIAEHPEATEAVALLASLLKERDPDEAGILLRQAREGLRADRLYYYQALGTEDDEGALRLLARALEENPWYFDAKWHQTVRHQHREDYAAMLDNASLLVKVRPDSPVTWTAKGAALSKLGRQHLPEAVACFGEAIELSKDDWLGYYNRAWAYRASANPEAALQDLRRAAERAPDEWIVHRLAGHVHYEQHAWDEAEAAYGRAIEAGADDARVFMRRGLARLERDAFDAAAADLSEAARRTDSDELRAFVLERRGEARYWSRDLDGAREDFEQSIATYPGNATAVRAGNFRAGSFLLTGRYEDALRYWLEDPANPQRHLGLGLSYWLLERHDEALEHLSEVARTPENAWVHLWIWEILMRQGERGRAERALAAAESAASQATPLLVQAVELLRGAITAEQLLTAATDDEQRALARYALGSQALIAGRPDDARDWFRGVVELGRVRMQEHELAEIRLRELDGS